MVSYYIVSAPNTVQMTASPPAYLINNYHELQRQKERALMLDAWTRQNDDREAQLMAQEAALTNMERALRDHLYRGDFGRRLESGDILQLFDR